jgi:hypothetical protein
LLKQDLSNACILKMLEQDRKLGSRIAVFERRLVDLPTYVALEAAEKEKTEFMLAVLATYASVAFEIAGAGLMAGIPRPLFLGGSATRPQTIAEIVAEIEQSPRPLPSNLVEYLENGRLILYKRGDPLPPDFPIGWQGIASSSQQTGTMVIRKSVWEAACDPKKARLFWEEFDHSRRILTWPKSTRWARMLLSRSALFSLYDEARAGAFAMNSMAYGLSYGLAYPFYQSLPYGVFFYTQMGAEVYGLNWLIDATFGGSIE